MYESLLRLPYFQGMSKDEITSILDKVAFDFHKLSDGETICDTGDRCDSFIIVTDGKALSTIVAPDGTYSLTEEIESPHAIEPYSLFGKDTTFKRKYTANGNCTILVIDKQYLFSEFTKYEIFTINLLNLISRRAQMQSYAIWNYTPTSIKGRIVQFIGMRCNSLAGRKSLQIKMERLAGILCETRLNVSKALNELQDEGYIELHRKEIIVPSLKRMLDEITE
jgi:CRP-like cAMP-binding protein